MNDKQVRKIESAYQKLLDYKNLCGVLDALNHDSVPTIDAGNLRVCIENEAVRSRLAAFIFEELRILDEELKVM